MQIGPISAGEITSAAACIASVASFVASIWCRATVAELKVELARDQENRCARCRSEFASAKEVTMLANLIGAGETGA